jgi:MFS family permease
VTFDGEDDPENPLNWSSQRKWTATILVSCFTFISPFSSTMVTPALDEIGNEFGIHSGFRKALIMSIFLLGFAQGPFLLAPLSELYGRVSVLQYANLFYLAFNTACGFSKTGDQMLAFRFLAGIGGSAPQALCNGVLADTWRKEERGKGQSVYGILTFIAPALAPIVGAFVSNRLNWRWIFYITSIFDVIIQVAALFFLRETYAPTILARKARKLRKKTGDMTYRTETEQEPFWHIFRRALVRPFIMLFLHPAVQAPSIYRAFLYGIMYLV